MQTDIDGNYTRNGLQWYSAGGRAYGAGFTPNYGSKAVIGTNTGVGTYKNGVAYGPANSWNIPQAVAGGVPGDYPAVVNRDNSTGIYPDKGKGIVTIASVVNNPLGTAKEVLDTGNQFNPLKDILGIGSGGTAGQGLDKMIGVGVSVLFIFGILSVFKRRK